MIVCHKLWSILQSIVQVCAPIAHTPPLEGEVGCDQSGSDLKGGAVLGNDKEIESAIRWWTLLLIWRSRR